MGRGQARLCPWGGGEGFQGTVLHVRRVVGRLNVVQGLTHFICNLYCPGFCPGVEGLEEYAAHPPPHTRIISGTALKTVDAYNQS